ncbi:WD40-repeat-containing domain protein [Scenedesmus sp. NREL 46B-D3]|nr:WD40-repeat-containing domain protein [Scenedesmus sp. NREL 46B-D3]
MAEAAPPGQQPQQQLHQHVSPAEQLSARWNAMFRTDNNLLYDTLLWTSNDWPQAALQWQTGSWQLPEHLQELQQQAATDAEEEALAGYELDGTAAGDRIEEAAVLDAKDGLGAAAAAGVLRSRSSQQWFLGGKQLLPMPLDFQYLLTGDQTGGQEAAHLVLWRVRLPGQLPAGFDPAAQQLAMLRGEVEPVLSIPHGMLDVNRLHSMPSRQHVVATCCDEPEIYLFDLQRQAEQQRQQQHQRRSIRNGSPNGSAGAAAAVSDDGGGSDIEDDNAASSQRSGDSAMGSRSRPQSEAVAAVLGGREAGGYALEWNPEQPGLLLAADVAGGMQLYDVQRGSRRSSSGGSSSSTGQAQIPPLQSCLKFASCAVNNVSWHSSGSTFAAATENGELLLQDMRVPSTGSSSPQPAAVASSSAAAAAAAAGCTSSVLGQLMAARTTAASLHVSRNRGGQPQKPHADCLTVEFDPSHAHRLATGGRDGYVYVLDMRRMAQPLEKLSLHAGDVRQVSWSRCTPGLLASAGEDGHVLLWDVHKMRHSLRKQQQQRQQQASAAAAAAAPAAAAEGGGGGGLGLAQPRRTQLSDALAQLAQPGLLFAHQGHIAAVEGLAWNPDRWVVRGFSCFSTVVAYAAVYREDLRLLSASQGAVLACE